MVIASITTLDWILIILIVIAVLLALGWRFR